MKSLPFLASVIMPAYNHAGFVEEAITSVLNQTYERVELIVIDDGSSDETPEIVSRMAGQLGFTFIRNEENLGLNPTLEKALASAQGDFVSILASDDLILPDKIERQIAFLMESGLDGVYANGFLLTPKELRLPIDLTEAAEAFKAGRMLDFAYRRDTAAPLLQSGLFRARVMRELIGVRRDFKSDDWVFLIKALENFRIGFLDEPLFLYRQHASNSHRQHWETLPMRIDVVCRAIPENARPQALAALFSSQASYLRASGNLVQAIKFALASIALHPSPMRLVSHLRRRVRAARRKLLRLAGAN